MAYIAVAILFPNDLTFGFIQYIILDPNVITFVLKGRDFNSLLTCIN